MILRKDWQIRHATQMGKNTGHSIVVRLPVKASCQLATAYCVDGKAIVRLGMAGYGVLMCDWSKFMRYCRRHGLLA